MPSFNDAQTTDQYQGEGSGAPTIEGILPLPNGGGRFNINSGFGAVFCQVQYGGQGAIEWAENEEQLLNPGAYGTIPDTACGIRFRSAVAGTPGKVSASIGTDPTRPALSIEALGAVSPLVTAPRVTRQIFTAGVSAYVIPAGVTAILVECVGSGGGGGGVNVALAGQVAVAGGGGGGNYAAKLIPVSAFVAPNTLVVSVGSGGSGGVGAANGGAGDVSFLDESGGAGFWVQAKGGAGGVGAANAAAPMWTPGGAGGGGITGPDIGDLIVIGGGGGIGLALAASANAHGGDGGAGAVYGSPVLGNTGLGFTGTAGTAFGSGGGGAGRSASTASQAGGLGHDGLVVITEYY